MAAAATAAAATATAVDTPDGASQTVRAQLRLRALVIGGELKPGERIAELAMVERLGMSRTPIRMALVRLQEEGLLEALPSGGFMVRDFSDADIADAIELRGTLEGLAARLAAERGVAAALFGEMRDCLERIDALLAPSRLSEEAFSSYVEHNARFHQLLAAMSGSRLVQRQIERNATLPFASPNAFVMAQASGPRARDRLVIAQEQHRGVVEAIVAGEGARAEALMREHARNARANLDGASRSHPALQRMPGTVPGIRRAPRGPVRTR